MGESSPLERPIHGWTRLWSALLSAPDYPPSSDDLRTVSIAGLRVPLRASTAIVLFVLLVVLDYNRSFFPAGIPHDQSPTGVRAQAIDRAILFGLFPLLTILIAFRDQPARYGLRIGDWRVGIPLALLGCVLSEQGRAVSAVAVAVVVWLTLVSERVSFSTVIDPSAPRATKARSPIVSYRGRSMRRWGSPDSIHSQSIATGANGAR